MKISKPPPDDVYKESEQLASEHYENFPVASFLFPKPLRKDVTVIYAFARRADDIADEGHFSEEERIHKLNSFRASFQKSLQGHYDSDFWKVLSYTIKKRNLDPSNFTKLLSAFEQDITKKRYNNFEEIIDYCERSANPVGRLILQLYNSENEHTVYYSDKICSALQITNFLQDVSIDIKKGRIYLPLEDMRKFEVLETDFYKNETSNKLKKLIEFEVGRVDRMFVEGEEILNHLNYRLKLQVGWTINGGRTILRKIKKNNYEVLNYRPTLSKIDYITAMINAFIQ